MPFFFFPECLLIHMNIPFYIFSESYGGKMAAGIALELQKVTGKMTLLFGSRQKLIMLLVPA